MSQQSQSREMNNGSKLRDTSPASHLKWKQSDNWRGPVQMNSLSNVRNIVSALRREYTSSVEPVLQETLRDSFSKRMLMIEQQIEGLLRRNIETSVTGGQGRSIDYSSLLNDKENQLMQLSKKIHNLEERLRRSLLREQALEDRVVVLAADIKTKQDLITLKHDAAQAEVVFGLKVKSTIQTIKRNLEYNRAQLKDVESILFQGVDLSWLKGVEFRPEILMRGGKDQANWEHRKRLVHMFREFERLCNETQAISEMEIQRVIEGFLLNMPNTKLYEKVQSAVKHYLEQIEHNRLRDNFTAAASIYRRQLEKLERDNPQGNLAALQGQDSIFELLNKANVHALQCDSGDIFISTGSDKVVQVLTEVQVTKEVPVMSQSSRSQHLLYLLATQLRRLHNKYPKLQSQIDPRLKEFFEQQLIDSIEVNDLDRIVSIVKYVAQPVRVDNVYLPQKDRRVQFHLRVLLKALLQQVQKLRGESGVVLSVDEGVIGMIRQEIMDVVNVDDILKVYRTAPKIVEVQKIVEKIVERIIQVPQVIVVEKIVEKIVQVEKIKEVDRIVNVPLETPYVVKQEVDRIVAVQNTVERIVEVPTVVERLVELVRQVPKIVEVQRVQQKIVQVERVVQVQRVVNHIQQQAHQVQVIVEKIVPVEKIVEKIVQVPVIVQKIVERVVEIEKIKEVQKIVQKMVPVVEYRNAKEVQNYVEVQFTVVDRIVEKLVPVVHVVERIKEVPQIVQVIKQVVHRVVQIKEVEVIREKIIIEERIKEVVRVEQKVVEVIKEVIKEVDRFVQVPVIHERLVTVTQIVEKPLIQKIESVQVKEVYLRDPIVVREPMIVEVEKIVNHYIEVPKAVKYIEERIVEVPKTIDRIKEVRVIVQKIIEKMVEVPKIVEVEKIVEKIVVVPRVIEKVVEIPQIIEKAVEKEVIKEVIREVEKIVQVPVFTERVVEVEVIRNVYVEVDRLIERVQDKLVEVPKYEEKIVTRDVVTERLVEVIKEVPKYFEVDKIVPQVIESVQIVQLQKEIIVPLEIAVPVDKIVEKVVPLETTIQRMVQVPQIVQKNVPVVQQVVHLQQVQKQVERIVIEQRYKEIEKVVPYYNEIVKEVPTIVQKIVQVQSRVQEIVTAQQIIQKVVQRCTIVPQLYQVERLREKLVQVPKIIQIQRMVPQIIRVNNYIQKIVQKIVQVPIIVEHMKEIMHERQKVVAVNTNTQEILQVEKVVEKLVFVDKIQEVVRSINHIEQVLKIVDRFQQLPFPVHTVEERLLQVPMVLEKIVEKIVIMPQIVEVLKYVHQVCEQEQLGVAVGADVTTHQRKYKALVGNINTQLDMLLRQLRGIKNDDRISGKVESIQKFLEQLRTFILFPRIVKVIEEKPVERTLQVEKIVKVQVQDQRSVRMQLSLSLLAEKLINEIKRVQQETKVKLQLDEDIQQIFFNELDQVQMSGEMEYRLRHYSEEVQRQFASLGSWSTDHQLMLKSFLQERFMMAELFQNANSQIQEAQAEARAVTQQVQPLRRGIRRYQQCLSRIHNVLNQNATPQQILAILIEFEVSDASSVPTRLLSDLTITEQRIQSLIRTKDEEINILKHSVFTLQLQLSQLTKQSKQSVSHQTLNTLKAEIERLTADKLNQCLDKQSSFAESYRQQIRSLQSRNLDLERQVSQLRSDNFNLQSEIKLRTQDVGFKKDIRGQDEETSLQQSRDTTKQSIQLLTARQAGRMDEKDLAMTTQRQKPYHSIYLGQSGSRRKQDQRQQSEHSRELDPRLHTPTSSFKYSSVHATELAQCKHKHRSNQQGNPSEA